MSTTLVLLSGLCATVFLSLLGLVVLASNPKPRRRIYARCRIS